MAVSKSRTTEEKKELEEAAKPKQGFVDTARNIFHEIIGAGREAVKEGPKTFGQKLAETPVPRRSEEKPAAVAATPTRTTKSAVTMAVPAKKPDPLPSQVKKILKDEAIVEAEMVAAAIDVESKGGPRLNYKAWTKGKLDGEQLA